MIFTETKLQGAFIVDVECRRDDRGFFGRAFCRHEFEDLGLEADVAQTNVGVSVKRGTLRGMHFQYPPAVEAKLVRCMHGAILDVIVDLRPESSTFLEHVAVELSGENQRALYIPGRFAHGYQTLQDETAILYQASTFYAPGAEGGLRYDDPRLNIAWPLPVAAVSDKDSNFDLLETLEGKLAARMSPARPEAVGILS
ncbi:MAG: dTDP-4-dehydrorhamnose 3,5-epimerase [Proteobacteria bacterium]|nr:dTDP-4-dehydrorhamnose 3,5-epimerase [Pseudomonadota bacterium]